MFLCIHINHQENRYSFGDSPLTTQLIQLIVPLDLLKLPYRLAFWWVAKRFGFNPTTVQNAKASIPGWNKIRKLKLVKSDGAGLPVYLPRNGSPPPKMQYLRSSSPSLAGSIVELDTYATLRSEKSIKLSSPASSAPPEYSQPSANASTSSGSSPQPFKPLSLESGNRSLRTADSNDRIYISEDAPRHALTRTPSPAPFTDIAIPRYNLSLPSSVYPSMSSHSTPRGFPDAIRVTIHTHSESTETL